MPDVNQILSTHCHHHHDSDGLQILYLCSHDHRDSNSNILQHHGCLRQGVHMSNLMHDMTSVGWMSNVGTAFGMCCNHGKVVIDALVDLPKPLRQLLLENSVQGKEFRNNMWQYNIALSFTSLGVTEDQSVNCGRGPPIFKIQGELCHRAGALITTAGHVPSYVQLYIYEPHAALDYRMQNNNNLRRDTMDLLQTVITANHQFTDIFMHAHEVLAQNPDTEEAVVRLCVALGAHRRCGNLPTADEVAVILPGDQSQMQARDIIL
ncbi:hypothetical protein B0H10DRAFT_2208905 [Mycena sp. CBHHK59/15]|nr:hypothetical protein B0H10DRAFT_2208905 [Mycena sp. CBHHK59/15]